jgi:hypothetical protein
VKYGELVRAFDETATAKEMQQCANELRARYRSPDRLSDRQRVIAEAAYCAVLRCLNVKLVRKEDASRWVTDGNG